MKTIWFIAILLLDGKPPVMTSQTYPSIETCKTAAKTFGDQYAKQKRWTICIDSAMEPPQ